MRLSEVLACAGRLLPPASRREAWLLGLVVALNGVAEVTGLAGLLPVVAVASDPQALQNHPRLASLYAALGLESQQAFAVLLGAAFLGLFVLVNLVGLLALLLGVRFSHRLSHRLSVALLGTWFGRPYVWLLGRNTAELSNQALHEVDGVVRDVYQPLVTMVTHGVTACMVAAALVVLDPAVALTTGLGMAALFTLVYRINRKHLGRIGEARARLNSERHRVVAEGLAALKEARLLARRGPLLERFDDLSRHHAVVMAQADVASETPRFATEVAAVVALVAAMLYLSLTGRGGVPWLMVAVMGTWRLVPALQKFYRNYARVRFFAPALARLAEELKEPPGELPEGSERVSLQREIRLREVRFAYPGSREDAVDGVSLAVPRGQRVALVGATGSGKTTLADLLGGLLVPSAGTVEVDGRPLEAGNLPGWHRNVGYVPQEIYLTDDTVARNIALGVPDREIDRAEVERAARAACVHEFVAGELPRGYDTPLGERGVALSGGQRQRIGIARALYGRPQVLILDEATSSLDVLTQRRVLESLAEAGGDLTVLVIAHRLEVVRECDRIFLLERGRLQAEGTWHELLRADPLFQTMARQEAEKAS